MEFKNGVKDSIPIVLGYLPVSFTFGMIASGKGISTIISTIISLTNFTSAGQFAGINIIVENGAYIEIAITTIIINIRYTLMALSLSEKMKDLSIKQRMIVGFGITDETFAVASINREKISFSYMLGLILPAYLAWGTGTLLGGIASNIVPERLEMAMGIALYSMFLAIIIPEARKNTKISLVIGISVLVAVGFKYVNFLSEVPQGWVVIIATVLSAGIGAFIFPRREV